MTKTEIVSGASRRTPQTYKSGPIWENVLYGVGSLIVIGGPILIPGLTLKDWIIGFFGGAMMINIVICLIGVWKSLNR